MKWSHKKTPTIAERKRWFTLRGAELADALDAARACAPARLRITHGDLSLREAWNTARCVADMAWLESVLRTGWHQPESFDHALALVKATHGDFPDEAWWSDIIRAWFPDPRVFIPEGDDV